MKVAVSKPVTAPLRGDLARNMPGTAAAIGAPVLNGQGPSLSRLLITWHADLGSFGPAGRQAGRFRPPRAR